jgi:hypothetical protein
MVSVMNLVGLPMMRGWLRKDIVLEMFLGCGRRIVIERLLYGRLVLTYAYSFKIVWFCGGFDNRSTMKIMNGLRVGHVIIMLVLCLNSIVCAHKIVGHARMFVVVRMVADWIKVIPIILVLSFMVRFLRVGMFNKEIRIRYYRYFNRIIGLRIIKSYVRIAYYLVGNGAMVLENGLLGNRVLIKVPDVVEKIGVGL